MSFTHEELKDYLTHVGKLYTLTSTFIKYYNDVIKQANGRMVHELQEDLRNMVLSGLKPDGEYIENAYALFIKDFTGLSIEDPKLYVAKLKVVEKPDVKVIVQENPFIEFALLLNKVSGFIVDKAKELNLGEFSAGESGVKQQNIEDLITEIIKTSYEVSVGVHNFPTSVFGLRKITPQYMKKAYGNIPENLLKSLGFSKLMSLKSYELWGFPDYFTKCVVYVPYGYRGMFINGIPARLKVLEEIQTRSIYLQTFNPVEPKTLGGAICILNEIVWRYINLLYRTLSKWYENIINLEKKYVEEAWKSLSDSGWRWSLPKRSGVPEYLEYLKGWLGYYSGSEGGYFRFLIYDEDGLVSKYAEFTSSYAGSVFFKEEHILQLSPRYIVLPELFNDLMPAIFVGVVDATLSLDVCSDGCHSKKALLILVRW